MTYGPMYAYVAYIGNVLFPDGLVVSWSWSEPVKTGLVTAKKPEKTGLQRSGSVFRHFGNLEDRSRSRSEALEPKNRDRTGLSITRDH